MGNYRQQAELGCTHTLHKKQNFKIYWYSIQEKKNTK